MINNVVLDTNCLIASLSKRGNYFKVWTDLQAGKYILCVSNEILEEYEEIIAQKANPLIAANVIQTLINSPFVRLIDTYFRFNLIDMDKNDNKFVDCAIAANASFIVSEDSHFRHLKEIPFPHVNVIKLSQFMHLLNGNNIYDFDHDYNHTVNETDIEYHTDAIARQAQEEINRLWETGELNEEKVESFRHLHERTPYK